MGWQKDEERKELCFNIFANECFCLKNGSDFAGLGITYKVDHPFLASTHLGLQHLTSGTVLHHENTKNPPVGEQGSPTGRH